MIKYRRQLFGTQTLCHREIERHMRTSVFFFFLLLAIHTPADEQYKFNISSTGPIPGT